MMRRNVWAAVAVAAVGAAFVTGAAVPSRAAKPPAEPGGNDPKPIVLGQKTGYFNMMKVMRDSRRAKTAVARLAARKDRMAANLVGLRNMYLAMQAALPRETNPKKRDEMADGVLRLARQIEDTDREVNKILNGRASLIIAELHDELKAEVAAVARDHGLVAVLAYPDAVTPDEAENPLVKELRLKPPAAQPFYLDPAVDFTGEILRRLNDRFADND